MAMNQCIRHLMLIAGNNPDPDSESEGEEDGELSSSRLENLHWCTCAECSMMPTLVDAKCCPWSADNTFDFHTQQ